MSNPIPNALVEAEATPAVLVGAGMSYPALGILGEHVRNAIGGDIRKDFSDYDPPSARSRTSVTNTSLMTDTAWSIASPG
jgi:hypothetical protein